MSAPLWAMNDLLVALDGRPVGELPPAIDGISIDSRTLGPGDCFFAIAGETFDGHDFVGAALANGAGLAVVSRQWHDQQDEPPGALVIVEDVLEALRRLGSAARARSGARIAAVTGSVGKTGTKDMLAAALGAAATVHFSPASFNNHWGVPLTLARMPPEAAFAVIEIGMNHAGEIAPLVRLVRPHVVIITTVEAVHLAHFDAVEDIARAKAEIFTGLEPGGTALINRDNPHFALLASLAEAAGAAHIAGFGEDAAADVRLDHLAAHSDGSVVAARVFGEEVTYKLGAPGRHVVHNSLAVLGAVAALGGDLARGALALADLPPPPGRGRRYRMPTGGGEVVLIDESYNANPASMRAAIGLLGEAIPQGGGRRIAVLGDMLELGDASADLHVDLAQILDAAGVDTVFAAGPMMASLWKALPSHRQGGYAETAAALENRVIGALAPGDVVMVKGSNGSRLGPLVASMRAHFDPLASGREQRRRENA
ncbi:MAG: UDP-N-acetylmuramoylalanyl-D-glutamyl-2,6-diaminopimelate--D-alanyl-D-alanine ligase [Alphaproteobacteria bacterium]